MTKILGVDPGLAMTGWALLARLGSASSPSWIEGGLIRTSAGDPLPLRLHEIFSGFTRLLCRLEPEAVAIEEIFFLKASRSILGTAQARGSLLLACAAQGIPVHEYNPRTVKMALTGNGNAPKSQILKMAKQLLRAPVNLRLDDVADAAAVAHAHLRAERFRKALVST